MVMCIGLPLSCLSTPGATTAGDNQCSGSQGHIVPDRLFFKALVIMIVRHLHTVHELRSVLEQETAEMQTLRTLLTVDGQFPTRRTWDRRLNRLPDSLPAQIGCLGRMLVELIQPWA